MRRYLRATVFLFSAAAACAQTPVRDALTIAKCGGCHKPDAAGVMDFVSSARSTPEGWQDEIRRTVQRQKLDLTPEDARKLVQYLSNAHGLAPAEAKLVMSLAERRQTVEASGARDPLTSACSKCHTVTTVLSWRRTPGEWKRFLDEHTAEYAVQAQPGVLADLTARAGYDSTDWRAWQAQTKRPSPVGRWLAVANVPGHGRYWGEVQVSEDGSGGFKSRVQLTSMRDGAMLERSGIGVTYAGYAWRGRSSGSTAAKGPGDPNGETREALCFDADGLHGEGRWFQGQYSEFGFDVKLTRVADTGASVLAADPVSAPRGTQTLRVRLAGDRLPARVSAADVSFGAGITVQRVAEATPTSVVVEIATARDAAPGRRDVAVAGSVLAGGFVVYDRVDYLKVVPESAVASFSDRTHDRGYVPFEVVAYQRGPDGKVQTEDDLELGPVDVDWSVHLFHAPDGSGSEAVGKMTPEGLFEPVEVNPGHNFDAWATATARNLKDAAGKALTSRAYLVVAPPVYTVNGRRFERDLDHWRER